jgi:hypothetical protein
VKPKWLITIFLMLIALSACDSNKELSLVKDQPTQVKQETLTSSPSPTLKLTATPTKTLTTTPTVTSTSTIFPTPAGEMVSDTVVDFSFFVPENYKNISGIYRRSYSFAAIYQEDQHWIKAIVLMDIDKKDQDDLPLSFYLLTSLDNLEYFNATVKESGVPYSIDINSYKTLTADFTGLSEGHPIQGQIIGYEPDDESVIVGISWFDVSEDPKIWEHEGIFLFRYVFDSIER